jgi:hypothetical protein
MNTDRTSTHQSYFVAPTLKAGQKAIDQNFTSASLRMSEISPTRHNDAHLLSLLVLAWCAQ